MSGCRAVDVSTLEVRFFGPFEVRRGDEPIPSAAWGRRKTQTLGKILLSERGRIFTQDQLLELLYPGRDPTKVVRNLQGRVSELRRALEPDLRQGGASRFVKTVGSGYCFPKEAPCWLDIEAFRASLETARELERTDRWSQARACYQQALELYRGDFLAEDLHEEWTLAPRESYRELYLSALEQLAECCARLQDYAQALRWCEKALEIVPYRESAYRRAMLYHSYAGQSEKSRQMYETCVQALKEHLDVEPSPETRSLLSLIVRGKLPALERATPHNLPVDLTPFVGRKREVQRLIDQLRTPSCRLLTLVGPGGVGKTRLALKVAEALRHEYPDGVYAVELSAVASPEGIVPAIAEALGLSFYGDEDPQRRLLGYLRERRMLLLLDNFEHLKEGKEGADLVLEILRHAPSVTLLVTSRERLDLPGEWLFPLQGLDRPLDETVSPEELEQYGAVRLLLNAWRRVDPDFTPTAEDGASLVRICRLVDGMPLGIELAAAWGAVLSCEEIAEEIERSLDFLAASSPHVPERHRSLRAVFEHSWSLLTGAEQAVLRGLSVFPGGFSREAAERVAGASLSLLALLVGKSLVRRTAAGRYELHELIKQYAQEKLREHPRQAEEARARHGRHYAQQVRGLKAKLQSERQREALEFLALEFGNVRAAWEWALERDVYEALIPLMEALYPYYQLRGRYHEGERAFARAVSLLRRGQPGPREDPARRRARAKALAYQGRLAARLGRYDQAQELLQRSLALLQQEPDDRDEDERVFLLSDLGSIAQQRGHYDRARRLLEEARERGRKTGHRLGLAAALTNLALLDRPLGRLEEAQSLLRESLAIYRDLGVPDATARTLNNLGGVSLQRGEHLQARRYLEESLALHRRIGDPRGTAIALLKLAHLHKDLGDYARAQELLEESLATFRRIAYPYGIADALNDLGIVATHRGDPEEAKRRYQESVAVAREVGNRWQWANALNNLGRAHGRLGERREAKRRFREALELSLEIGAVPLALDALVGLARLLAHEGHRRRALELLGCALHHPGGDRESRQAAEEVLAELTGRTNPPEIPSALERGRGRSLEEIAEEILSG